MHEPGSLRDLQQASVVAPAGHGKTEEIVKLAALGSRTLVLTHTHAGVHAIRHRLKKFGVPHGSVAVDTIAGWATRYANAFPARGNPPSGMPRGDEWNQVYRGGNAVLGLSIARQVVEASYDRILIDEYQDCDALQHELAISLSRIRPTMVFGDPMQGIFEFTGSSVRWQSDVFPIFPLARELETPWRWQGKNDALGAWIADVRKKLLSGQSIDLAAGPIDYRPVKDAFDMGVFFDRFEERSGSVAAIHCRRGTCDSLAQATRGAFQSIEEIAAKRLLDFGREWDHAPDSAARAIALRGLVNDGVGHRKLEEGESDTEDDRALTTAAREALASLSASGEPEHAMSYLSLLRRHSRARTFRGELMRDAYRALSDVQVGRQSTLQEAAIAVRQRLSMAGRGPQKRTVSTPLLLKGLEFDHVVVPDATHFLQEKTAAAKLFYVAISRARIDLTIASSQRHIQFPVPNT